MMWTASAPATLALEGTLVAAVRLNRWNAMDAFSKMLIEVKDGADAVAVAEMLRRRINEYREVAEKTPAAKLHVAIGRVRSLAMQPQTAIASSSDNDESPL